LYGYWRSSCSYRVRIALNLKGLKYKYIPVHLRKEEQKAPDFAEKSPNQTVPVLSVAGKNLTQSLAIIDYLEETCAEFPLLPKDPLDRAQVRSLAQMIACDIQPLQNLRVLGKVSGEQSQRNEWAKNVNLEGLTRVEKAVAKTAGKYSFGNNVTLADLCLVPQVYNAIRFGLDVATLFPTIHRVNAALNELQAFKDAHPDNQIDAEKGV